MYVYNVDVYDISFGFDCPVYLFSYEFHSLFDDLSVIHTNLNVLILTLKGAV